MGIQRQGYEDEKEPTGPWLSACKPSNRLPKALLTTTNPMGGEQKSQGNALNQCTSRSRDNTGRSLMEFKATEHIGH